jgi:hypothetical protein
MAHVDVSPALKLFLDLLTAGKAVRVTAAGNVWEV